MLLPFHPPGLETHKLRSSSSCSQLFLTRHLSIIYGSPKYENVAYYYATFQSAEAPPLHGKQSLGLGELRALRVCESLALPFDLGNERECR
jgi:hypothetical protein